MAGNWQTIIGQAAILGLTMTVMIERVGLLDLAYMTEWTNPVTSDPSAVKDILWRRCWSYRKTQQLLTRGHWFARRKILIRQRREPGESSLAGVSEN